MTKDNRSCVRQKTNLWVKELDGDYFFIHNATNLSKGGMYIENALPRSLKKELSFSVHLPNKEEVRFKGKIVHSKRNNENLKEGFGIEFLSFEKGSVEDLVL